MASDAFVGASGAFVEAFAVASSAGMERFDGSETGEETVADVTFVVGAVVASFGVGVAFVGAYESMEHPVELHRREWGNAERASYFVGVLARSVQF